jgi:phosphoglycolate phosphatase-like HAD superfamily hydrolase
MVGDGPADLLAARRAGLPAIAVRGPDSSEHREALLREYRPLALIDRTEELLSVFEERDRLGKESEG